MLIQLGQVSLYRCQSNQWFINRRANDENSDGGVCDEEEATPSNSIRRGERWKRDGERHDERCIARRIAENRQANTARRVNGGRFEGVEGPASRFAVCLDAGP